MYYGVFVRMKRLSFFTDHLSLFSFLCTLGSFLLTIGGPLGNEGRRLKLAALGVYEHRYSHAGTRTSMLPTSTSFQGLPIVQHMTLL